MSAQGYFAEKFCAVWFLLPLYFVHAFAKDSNYEVWLHTLREAVTGHRMSRNPLQTVSALGMQCPRFLTLVPEGFVNAL